MDAEKNLRLIKKAAKSLTPGGQMLILDIIREKKLTAMMDLIARTYGLIFFLFLGGQNYSFNQISAWLTDSGLAEIKRINLPKSGMNLIKARKR